MTFVSIKDCSVRTLFAWFDERRLAIPEIQREFVWNAQRACALLDSMMKGYPIGTAMIWTTGREQSLHLRHSLHVLPPFDPSANKEIYFLIDGQQRLSVLHLLRQGKMIQNSDRRDIDFGRIFLSLESEVPEFVYLRKSDPGVHFAMRDVLSDRWRQLFRGVSKGKLKKITDCRSRLLGYKVFIQFLKARDLADVRETFIRINTQGMKISEADRAFTAASRVRPVHRFRLLCSHLTHGFADIDKNIYWTTLALARGIREVGQRAFSRIAREINDTEEGLEWFEREEPRIAECLRLACDHLIHQMKVTDFKLLPYSQMIAILAGFFYWNNRAQPSPLQRKAIRQWFWHTAVRNRYAGRGYQHHLLSDAAFFERLGRTRKGRYAITEQASADSLLHEPYLGGSALSKAFRLLLASKAPRYIDNGDVIPPGPVASARNAKELHHIWPRDLLKRQGIRPERVNALCNICYLAAQNNRAFGAQHPLRYLADYWSRKHFAKVMNSHLIPYRNDSPLWDENIKRGFKAFLEKRRDLIVAAFNQEAKAKLFER